MEHLIYNLFPDVAAAVNRGDDYMMQLAQDAVQPILQSLLGLLVVFSPDGPNVLETIASTTMDLALPAANHIKALVASAVLGPLQDAFQLTGIPQALHWTFHHIHNAHRVLVVWLWKNSQTPVLKQDKKRARKRRSTAPKSGSQRIYRQDLEMGKKTVMPRSDQRRASVDIIGEPGCIIQLRTPEELLEFDQRGDPRDTWPEEIIVIEDFYDDDSLTLSDRLLSEVRPILTILVAMFLAFLIYLYLSRRVKAVRRQKKGVDSPASKSSSTPSNTTGHKVAMAAERDNMVRRPSSLSQCQSHPEARTSVPATNDADLSPRTLLIHLDAPQPRRRVVLLSPSAPTFHLLSSARTKPTQPLDHF